MLTGCAMNSGPEPDETITQKEINASALMNMESNREGALAAIASRKDLSQSDQVFLVKVIFIKLEQDQTKVNLLTTLIHNPAFGNAPKGVILDGMATGLKEDISRRRILQVLQERGPIDDMEVPATTR